MELGDWERMLRAYRSTAAGVRALERKINRFALETYWPTTGTQRQIEVILRMQERQRRLANECGLVRAAVARLGEEDRRLLALCFVRGLTYNAIAGGFALSERSFYRHRLRALKRFAAAAEALRGEWL